MSSMAQEYASGSYTDDNSQRKLQNLTEEVSLFTVLKRVQNNVLNFFCIVSVCTQRTQRKEIKGVNCLKTRQYKNTLILVKVHNLLHLLDVIFDFLNITHLFSI